MSQFLLGFIENVKAVPMSYTSVTYLILIVLAVLLYYILPKKYRWMVLLASSACFYYAVSTSKKQMVLFAVSILFGYAAALLLKRQEQKGSGNTVKKIILTVGIAGSVMPLLVSKCGEFILHIAHRAPAAWIIPVGLSFYSMQIISYLVDVYRGKYDPQKNFLKFALYISFFPIIIQGPISRYDQLSHSLYEGHSFDNEKLMRGIQLILWGLFLKYMIADKSSVIVNQVFDHYEIYSGGYIFLAGALYSIQLYTDFMSCVTMSKGVAELFGIDLIDNFRRPYFATSIKDFWRRWHISLSEWLRDYVYIPLGGNRKGTLHKYANLTITFAVSGLWHGGSLKYLFWGLMHAGYQIAGDLLAGPKQFLFETCSMPKGSKLRKLTERLGTWFLVTMAWIIFRAESLKTGIKMILSMFGTWNPWIFFDNSIYRLGLDQKEFEVLIIAILILLFVSLQQEKGIQIRDWFNRQNFVVRWIIYLLVIWSIWIFGTYGFGFNSADFIYGGF